MSEIPKLYRVTNQEHLGFDDQGYLLLHAEHQQPEEVDPPSVAMAEWSDLEIITRFLVFNGVTHSGVLSTREDFLVLEIDPTQVEGYAAKTHHYLEGKEHFGRVHRRAITAMFLGQWIEDYSHGVSAKVLEYPYAKKILDFTHGKRPVIQEKLTAEEMARELNGKNRGA